MVRRMWEERRGSETGASRSDDPLPVIRRAHAEQKGGGPWVKPGSDVRSATDGLRTSAT